MFVQGKLKGNTESIFQCQAKESNAQVDSAKRASMNFMVSLAM